MLIIFAGDVVTTARDDAHPQHTTNTQNKTKQNKTKKPQKAVGIGLLTGALFFQLPITPAGGRSVFGAAYLSAKNLAPPIALHSLWNVYVLATLAWRSGGCAGLGG